MPSVVTIKYWLRRSNAFKPYSIHKIETWLAHFRFARFYTRFPYVIGIIALLIAGTSTFVSYKCYNLTGMLSFDDPTAVSFCS